MGSKKKRNKDRLRSVFSEMIPECPYCGARSYPRVIADPKNEEEAKALFCGSCKRDLRPVIDHYKMEEAKAKALEAMKSNEEHKGLIGPSPQVMASVSEVV